MRLERARSDVLKVRIEKILTLVLRTIIMESVLMSLFLKCFFQS